jgi:anti-sigma factor (TIGR02949 family)
VTAHLDRYSCEEVFRRMDEYLDRELAPPEVERVRAHLETCLACAGEYRFEDTLLRDVRSKLRRVVMPADLRARIERELAALRAPREER